VWEAHSTGEREGCCCRATAEAGPWPSPPSTTAEGALSICRLGAWSGSGVRRGRRGATEPRHDWGIADIMESGGRWPGVGRRKWRDHRNPPDLSRRGHGRRAGGKEAAKSGGGGAKAGSPARKHRAPWRRLLLVTDLRPTYAAPGCSMWKQISTGAGRGQAGVGRSDLSHSGHRRAWGGGKPRARRW
jgi:hypothetical protein